MIGLAEDSGHNSRRLFVARMAVATGCCVIPA
jgi:hypothetical protein